MSVHVCVRVNVQVSVEILLTYLPECCWRVAMDLAFHHM